MKIGINAHPIHHQPAELAHQLAELGVHACRFPLWRGHESIYRRFVKALIDVAIEPLPVIDSNSFTPYQLRMRRYERGLQYWRKRFPNVRRVQVGNEPDQPDSPSSWYLPLSFFQQLLLAAERTWEGAEIVAGGLCHIDFSYLFTDWQNAAHLYAQDAQSVQLLTPLLSHDDRLPIVTEFGSEEPDEHARAQYFSSFLTELWREGYTEVFPYCYSRRQHPTLGIVDEDDNPLESYAAIQGAITALAGDPPAVPWPPEPPHEPSADPTVDYVWGHQVASFPRQPRGVILHGTSSGQADRSIYDEYISTLGYVATGTNGVTGWNVTGGEHQLCEHMDLGEWGWHARAASSRYLGYEFAHAVDTWTVTDAQVDTFCWWFLNHARWRWPALPAYFPTHAEVERQRETGVLDGKHDVYPFGDPRADELRARILARLG